MITDPTDPYAATTPPPDDPGDAGTESWAGFFEGIWERMTNPLPRTMQG